MSKIESPNEAEFVTVEEAAVLVSAGAPTIWRLARAGILPRYRLMARTVFRRSDVLRWADGRQGPPNAK